MNSRTEESIRIALAIDNEIRHEDIEHAIELMKGNATQKSELCKIVSFKDAMKILEVKRPTIQGYIRKGYLVRVLGAGNRAIGINGDSLDAFRQLRIVHKGK